MTLAPVLFVGHGAPSFALDKGLAAQNLAKQSIRLEEVDAILVISPHWMTQGNFVITNEHPETIHDFGGFSPALYELRYPAPGSGDIGRRVIHLLIENGFDAQEDSRRGWDHGVWVPLRHLRPSADKIIVQLSLNETLSPDELEHLGEVLKQLRAQNVAIVCSGSVTHNLYDLRMQDDGVAEYAAGFEKWAREVVVKRNIEDAKQPELKSEHYEKAHPTSEHYLPLLIAMAASDSSDRLEVLESPIRHHSISMESYIWS